MTLPTKILIANRGEIAVRIMRACREMNIQTVAIYSEADKDARHVKMADEALRVGPAPASESYLSIECVIDTARKSGAQAIHPGYGFLSENPTFAQAVQDAGIIFIGPSAQAIRAMGDKAEARARMQARGVPIVPGFQDANDDAALVRAADKIGYPVLVKAAAGGGGKAMHVVESPDDLLDALAAAHREAQNAFGDARLFLEKYIRNARHIEFQILADTHGRTLHLFERECSIQRRHQKIIEETPSPLLDAALRAKMGAAAVEAARAVGYVNAGTIEFIVDPDTATLRPGSGQGFYFLEMNTRLQVEHPITEMVTGLDLVQWQIRIAAGESLPFDQEMLTQRGHAIECRVYAEDASNQFLPSIGTLLRVIEPQAPGIRVDSGVETGDEITVHYDPMIAKVIAYAETRDAAIRKMQAALHDYVLLGVTTNTEFLQDVLRHPEFSDGKATTRFIEQHFPTWKPENQNVASVLVAAALAESSGVSPATTIAIANDADPYNPWARGDAFRLGVGS
ncbi:MAG: acetyl-CoA carboxylase biotin carboxylase subunit [Chloroflexi bacterium]|nr:acetyl-CoA carboxylase biotin carboxylase subunit [Chloroflexota bacterium]